MDLQPKMRDALVAAFNTPTRTLRRGPGGFVAFADKPRTSGPVMAEFFTRRTVNRLDEAGLVTLDDPQFPTTVALNTRGLLVAAGLVVAVKAKAGAA
jgi:hypothetical protein